MTDPIPSEPLPAELPLSAVFQSATRLRARHFDPLVRALMSVRPEDLDDRGAVAWDRVTPKDLDRPVSLDDVRAWLATRPPRGVTSLLPWVFDPRDPRAASYDDLVRAAAETHPDALVPLLSSSVARDLAAQARYALAGEALGEAYARAAVESPYASFAAPMQVCADAACAAYLRGAASVMLPHELSQVGNRLTARPSVSDAVRAAYGEALAALAGRLTNKQAGELFAYTTLADAASLEAALRASAKRPKVWARLAALYASQGQPQAAAALAALLDDKKLGRHVAAALATMGATGAAAARAWRDARGAKAKLGAELADALLAVPAAETALWEGAWRSLPRFGRAPREDLLAVPADAPAPPRAAPTPLAAIEAALVESPVADLLPPGGWADLLQILALDPHLLNPAWAWERANARGLLGRGLDPAAITAALDAVDWGAYVTKRHPVGSHGIGHVLLWAGAGRELFRHAIARFEEAAVLDVLGDRERHFTRALDLVQPAWAPSVRALLSHHGARRDETAWRGAPPVLATCATEASSAELPAPSADLWITARVAGASRVSLRLRGGVTLAVDGAAARWRLEGAGTFEGATPPLDPARPLRLSVETARDGLYFGVNGALLHGAVKKVPARVGPVTVTAEGEGARVEELTLHAKYTVRAAEAVGALLSDLDAAQGYTEVAGLETPAAAHALAAVAAVAEPERAAMAREALRAMKGDELTPWKELLRAPAAAPTAEPAAAPTAFTVRSFEDVVRAVYDARLGVKPRARKAPDFKRGQTEYGGFEYASWAPKPESEDWSARGAVPYPAVYLGDEAPSFDDPRSFLDAVSGLPALCRKGRGTMARGSLAIERGRYVVAALEVSPPDGYDDWSVWSVAAAAWKVDEGWAWAMMEGAPEGLLPLLGVRALPPQVAWATVAGALGDW